MPFETAWRTGRWWGVTSDRVVQLGPFVVGLAVLLVRS